MNCHHLSTSCCYSQQRYASLTDGHVGNLCVTKVRLHQRWFTVILGQLGCCLTVSNNSVALATVRDKTTGIKPQITLIDQNSLVNIANHRFNAK